VRDERDEKYNSLKKKYDETSQLLDEARKMITTLIAEVEKYKQLSKADADEAL